jgi:hypothetical protein
MSQPNDDACAMNEQAVALALHALDPDEENAVRTHLPHCRSCQQTVRSTESIMGSLGASVPQIDPPDRLRSSILARVAETPQDRADTIANRTGSSPRTPRRATPAPRPGERDDQRGNRPSNPGDIPRRLIRAARRRVIAVAVAVVVVLGFGGITAYTAQLQQQRDVQAAQTQALADLITHWGQPGIGHATLQSNQGQPVAAVLATRSGPTVVTSGLPPNRRDTSTYVLWGINAAGPHPLGAFDVTTGVAAHAIATADTGYSAYAISLEPGRVMPGSPTTVVASGPIQA